MTILDTFSAPPITIIPPSPASTIGIPLATAIEQVLEDHYKHTTRYTQAEGIGRQILKLDPAIQAKLRRDYGGCVEHVDTDYMMAFISICHEEGNANSTINIKLAFFSQLFKHFRGKLKSHIPGHPFMKPEVPWLPKSAVLKWWLNPELEVKMCHWLQAAQLLDYRDYIQWTTRSGLRVEESLRLQRMHFDFSRGTVTVPGTKTSGAQRTLPMFTEAKGIAERRFGPDAASDAFLFDFSGRCGTITDRILIAGNYTLLREVWNRLRDVHGLHRTPTATLKALRRSFARYATDNGMPTEVLKQYLGHEQIQTTMEYLKLVGGYNLDVMRKWIS